MAFELQEYISRAVLKIAITTKALHSAGLKIVPLAFGPMPTSPRALIATVVKEYSDKGLVPGFSLVQAKIVSMPHPEASYTFSDVLGELEKIKHAEIASEDAVICEYERYVKTVVAVDSVRTAYSRVVEDSTLGRDIDLETLAADISKRASEVKRPSKGMLIGELARVEYARNELPIKYGFTEMDTVTGGIYRGETVVVLGAPKGRKTTLLTNIAIYSCLINPDIRVAYISFEMAIEAMRQRFLTSVRTAAASLGVDLSSASDDAVPELAGIHDRLWISDAMPGASVDDVAALLDRLASENFVPDLLILDYMLFMRPTIKFTERRHQLAQVARDIVSFAKRYNVACITAHLYKREAVKSTSRITRADISESYEVVAVVDAVLAIQPWRGSNLAGGYSVWSVASRRFEDERCLGNYIVLDDGLTFSRVASVDPAADGAIASTAPEWAAVEIEKEEDDDDIGSDGTDMNGAWW
ncbi:MAG: hypothetical protein KatS3mg054_0090 [Chloroflexus sp.]|nr:MAG: hypothetical protein KatS3mg054_0090 [Chloroflexus sp.]